MNFGGFQKTSLVDYPGRVASILFSKGCNLRCGYCYNPDLVFSKTATLDQEALLLELKRRRDWVDAVVVTGGEPTVWPDLLDFLEKLKHIGLSVKLDTNGSNPQVLEAALTENLVDYVAMDVKAPLAKYREIAGACTPLLSVRRSVESIKKSGADYEFRTTVAPGLSENDLEEIAHEIGPAKRWFLQLFQRKPPLLDPEQLSRPALSRESILAAVSRVSYLFGESGFRGESVNTNAC